MARYKVNRHVTVPAPEGDPYASPVHLHKGQVAELDPGSVQELVSNGDLSEVSADESQHHRSAVSN
jgi:hypothetical protein